MQPGEQHLSRRGFFLTMLAAPAALAACAQRPAERAAPEPRLADPAASRPRVPSDPEPRVFAALRQVALDREVEPFAFEPAPRRRAR